MKNKIFFTKRERSLIKKCFIHDFDYMHYFLNVYIYDRKRFTAERDHMLFYPGAISYLEKKLTLNNNFVEICIGIDFTTDPYSDEKSTLKFHHVLYKDGSFEPNDELIRIIGL